MIRAVLTVEAQQLYCLTCSRILGPNLSQSRHICRKQKTSKAALVDIFLSFKLGSFSVSISRLLCSHISCSSSAHKPENQTLCLFLIKYSDFLVKGKRVVPYLSRRCRWRSCLLKSSWCSGSVMHTSKQNVKWTNQNLKVMLVGRGGSSHFSQSRRNLSFCRATWVFTVTKRKQCCHCLEVLGTEQFMIIKKWAQPINK